MVSLLQPDLLLLHQLLGFRVLIIALIGTHVLDEILRPLPSLHELSIESPVFLEYVVALYHNAGRFVAINILIII